MGRWEPSATKRMGQTAFSEAAGFAEHASFAFKPFGADMHTKFLAAGGSVPIRTILVRKAMEIGRGGRTLFQCGCYVGKKCPLVLGRPTIADAEWEEPTVSTMKARRGRVPEHKPGAWSTGVKLAMRVVSAVSSRPVSLSPRRAYPLLRRANRAVGKCVTHGNSRPSPPAHTPRATVFAKR